MTSSSSSLSLNPLLLLLIGSLTIYTAHARFIVGGDPVPENDYPGFVNPSLTDSTGILCGGTLVHEDMVLTAAHCAGAWSVGETVYLGANSILGADAEERRTVQSVRVHPAYNPNTLQNDVMMLKLNAASSQTTVSMADADGGDDPAPDEPVLAIGFGRTETNGQVSFDLLQVEIDVFSTAECRAIYGFIDGDTQICAGTEEGGKSVCNGDSGGPLFNSAGVQVGVSSFVHISGCAPANLPAGFARVSGQRTFIDEAICEMSDNPPASCLAPDDDDCARRRRRLASRNEQSVVPALCFTLSFGGALDNGCQD